MPRLRSSLPKVRLHKPTGQAICDYYDPGTGTRRSCRLGPFGSDEAQEKYARLVADLVAARKVAPAKGLKLCVAEVAARYIVHAEGYYLDRTTGKPSTEFGNIKVAIGVLVTAEGRLQADAFGPVAFRRVVAAMVARGWARTFVNAQAARIRRAFKWAASEELVPVTVFQGVATVPGLKRGRTTAPESEPVGPAPEADVEKTLPHLSGVLTAMVRFQRLTGSRPQDACQLRGDAIDRSAEVWVFRPGQHKGAWRGKVREVMIGPRAQAVIAPYVLRCGGGYLFSPAESKAEYAAARRAARKSKVWPSHDRRYAGQKKEHPKRAPGTRFTSRSYAKAVLRACRAAGVEPWAPNQLRHAAGTEIRREYGAEAARVALGHDKLSTTELYAERDRELAARVAAEVG